MLRMRFYLTRSQLNLGVRRIWSDSDKMRLKSDHHGRSGRYLARRLFPLAASWATHWRRSEPTARPRQRRHRELGCSATGRLPRDAPRPDGPHAGSLP